MKFLLINPNTIKYLLLNKILTKVLCKIFLGHKMIILSKDKKKSILKNPQEQLLGLIH